MLKTFQEAIAAENAVPMRMGYLHALLPFLRETGAWSQTESLLAPLAKPATLSAAERAIACHPTAGNPPAGVYERIGIATVRAHAAAVRGDGPALAERRRERSRRPRRTTTSSGTGSRSRA